jgi:hypothetical protein
MPASYVEEHLGQVTQEKLEGKSNEVMFDKNNTLKLKVDISLAKVHFNMVFGLHALLTSATANSEDQQDLISTWG